VPEAGEVKDSLEATPGGDIQIRAKFLKDAFASADASSNA
jgi:hypothetical protein